jgi:hypothetical protein
LVGITAVADNRRGDGPAASLVRSYGTPFAPNDGRIPAIHCADMLIPSRSLFVPRTFYSFPPGHVRINLGRARGLQRGKRLPLALQPLGGCRASGKREVIWSTFLPD